MKRLVCALGFVVVAAASSDAFAQAENYDPIRFDSGLTGSYVGASGRGGFGATAELKLMVHDNIAVGVRTEGQAMFGGKVGEDDVEMSLAAVVSGLVKAEYLLGNGPVRPFVGLGIGVYDIGSQTLSAGENTTGIDQKAGRYFGMAPQLGIDLGRLRLAATYNMILGADIEVRQMIGNAETTAEFSQSYLGFEMAVRFGGGRKHRPMPVMIVPPPPRAPMPPPAPPAAPTPAPEPTTP